MKIKKVLLIAPPAYTFQATRDINPLPPIGLGYLAAVIENLGIEVAILDALMLGWEHEEKVDELLIRVGLSNQGIEDCLRRYDPDLVGISCQFSRQYRIYHELLATIKKVKPECLTVAGGAHVTVCPKEILGDPHCDYIIMGEAEESLKDFLIKINKDEDISSVDGLGWKSNGIIHLNKKEKWVTNLDSLPFPAYHLINFQHYFGLKTSHGARHKSSFSPIVTSRGCPAKCTFCSAKRVWGGRYRFRSVEHVIAEMRLLRHRYGIEEIMFEDDNLTANPRRAARLFTRMIEERFNFTWDTPNGIGVWSIDEALIDLMKQSGCVNLNFPVESGSQEVLQQIIKKPLNLSRTKDLMAYCRKIGLSYNMFLIIGMPGESLGDIRKSFRFASECGCYQPHISVATPYPGTELYDICINNGYLSKSYDLQDLFIKSYMIKTADWNEHDLKKIMSWGQLYLLLKGGVVDPLQLLKRVTRNLREPSQLIKKLIHFLD
jgi:anaerobic magnesium-protoporphyrin IX monomethyl ester cyclase